MDESVALDSTKQKDFVKSVRGIKKLLKKKKEVVTEVAKEDSKVVEPKSNAGENKRKIKLRQSRGLVYLSHIPHGFYEQQMTEYFKQFGVVTNARVIRSRRTGSSKGFAFVEFKEPAVAEIVAETMNNYLMGKRLIKAAYIPPEKQRRRAQRKNWNSQNNPSRNERLILNKKHNADKSDTEELKMARKLLSNLSKTKQKLSNLGIDYNFFKPVDVPEALMDKLPEVTLQIESKPKNLKTEEKVKEIKSEPEEVNIGIQTNKSKKQHSKKKQNVNSKITISSKILDKKSTANKAEVESKNGNKQKDQEENNKIIKKHPKQKETKEKIKKGKVENFISIKKVNDSDSSIDFDSDEFEKAIEMESEDDLLSGDEAIKSEDEETNNIVSRKPVKTFKKKDFGVNIKNLKRQDKLIVKNLSAKRKHLQGAPSTAKKAKFEKQNKRPLEKKTKKEK